MIIILLASRMVFAMVSGNYPSSDCIGRCLGIYLRHHKRKESLVMRTGSSLNRSSAVAAVAAVALFGLAGKPARAQIQNPISTFPIDADGAYTTTSEWTDVTPAWFISDPSGGARSEEHTSELQSL